MHILYQLLKPQQEAEIKAIVDNYNVAVAQKNRSEAAQAVIQFAAYLNNNKVGSSLICITCVAAEEAIRYAVAEFALKAKEVKPTARGKKQNDSVGELPTADETNLEA
jgi:hypothetical protein